MVNAETLINAVQLYNPHCDHVAIRAAYDLCQKAHEGQLRRSGEPYYTHPVAVAEIIANMRLDDASLITALLHDTVEDTFVCYEDIADQFGTEIADLVDGVTQLTQFELNSVDTKQAENFRKLFMAMSRDLRVILVKLSDRLHNMRTIKAMPAEKQAEKARETIEIYAPLAGRIGMEEMRSELEELAFKVLNPEQQAQIQEKILRLHGAPDMAVRKIQDDIAEVISGVGIVAKLEGRAKKTYSVWRKMQEKEQDFSKLSDVYAFRVIVKTQAECYAALGALHARWCAVPGRFKDYISQPKSNGYRSLHTTVSGRDGKRVEIQIRTEQMHEVAESGVAAHWSYRDGVRIKNPFAVDPANWIKGLKAQMEAGDRHDDFLEQMKLEIYSEQIFVFTPKGDVIQLPVGSTPLDFAYTIHTHLGARCVGAKVDGMRVPLGTELKMGQSVEIISAEGQRPQASWIDQVKTGRARGAIRRSLREADHARFISVGRELIRLAFKKNDKRANEAILQDAARQQGLSSRDDLLAGVGSGEISTEDILQGLFPDAKPAQGEELDLNQEVIGLEPGTPFTLSQCCQPLPNERIIGIARPGRIFVHKINCEKLRIYEEEEWTDLRWQQGLHPPSHLVTLDLTIGNSLGVLGRICTLIGREDTNIFDLFFSERKPDFYRLKITLELRDERHLNSVVTALQADGDVAFVARFHAGAEENLPDQLLEI